MSSLPATDAAPAVISSDNPQRGIIMMLLSVLCFSVLNVLVKHLGDHYSIFQVAFFRCLFALVPALMLMAATGGFQMMKTTRLKGHCYRALVGTTSMLLIFSAFHKLPLATATAINFSGPLFVALFSILILHEKVGMHRWAALILGLVGVLVMLQPGQQAMDWLGAAMALGSAVFYGLSMVSVRALGHTEKPVTSVFYFSVLSTVITFVPLLWPGVWVSPTLWDFALFVAGGIVAGFGQLFMTRAYQCAPAATISPFGYSGILWATLFGFMLWGDIPGQPIFVGSAIVIAAGLYIVYRETILKRRMVTEVQGVAADQRGLD
jgi:drug/metabolite transporter (DMT)-like permease